MISCPGEVPDNERICRMKMKVYFKDNSISGWKIPEFTIFCLLFLLLVLIISPGIVRAQSAPRLYAAVVQRNNFVVGMKAPTSGLFGFDHDTTWTHYGWHKTRNFGISYDPGDPDFIFMACGNGALRTLDGGKSWRVTTDWTITEVQDVTIDPFHPDTAYIATAYGVWRTFNKGASWDSASTGLNDGYDGPVPNQFYVQTIQIDQQKGAYILTGGEGGIHRSTDAAADWKKVGPAKVEVRDIQQSKSNPLLWLAGTEDHGVLISHDAGQTWHYVKGRIAKETIYAVAVDPDNPDLMAAAGFQTGVYISTNGGKTWKQHKKGLPILDFHALIFDPVQKDKLWAGSVGAGVFSSNLDASGGDSWHYAGLRNAEVWDMIFVGGAQ